MQNKPAFTLMEMLIVLVLIGVIMGLTVFAYSGSQYRAKTSENIKRAQDIISAAEHELVFDETHSSYPIRAIGSLTWSNFVGSLPPAVKRNLIDGNNPMPDGNNRERLVYLNCFRSYNECVGIKIAYWNYVDRKVEYLTAGETEGSGIHCY